MSENWYPGKKRDMSGLIQKAAHTLHLHRKVMEYSGPVTAKNTRVMGVNFIGDFFPGITAVPEGVTLMRFRGKRGWALQLGKARCFATFRAGGRRRFRKGVSIVEIFQKWSLESAQQIQIDDWIKVGSLEDVLTKEQADAILNAETYDAATDKELYR